MGNLSVDNLSINNLCMNKRTTRAHGGTDAGPAIVHDFSTNSNALGPCPYVVEQIQACDVSRYPDPNYQALRQRLAQWHDVEIGRIVVAASASEFIFRFSLACALEQQSNGNTAQVFLPQHGYGDYASAATALGLLPSQDLVHADLIWTCEPSSPLGSAHPQLTHLIEAYTHHSKLALVLDCAYQDLRLSGQSSIDQTQRNQVWQLFSPNKALGLTGIRGAYAIAPSAIGHGSSTLLNQASTPTLLTRLSQLAPSWPLGAHAHAMLEAWTHTETQTWLAQSRLTLTQWKARQIALCKDLQWQLQPSEANFFCVKPFDANSQKTSLQLEQHLRQHGIKVRTTESFDLPHHFRLGVRSPQAQDALRLAVDLFYSTPT